MATTPKSSEAKSAEPLIRNVSDTALWVAYYRALESERPDAHFRDPYARRLAGERGAQIVASRPNQDTWPFVARTWGIDEFIRQQIREGADTIVNLAAGLDTRPYRMELPQELRWIEVDLPPLLAYKESILAGETPKCRLERVALDLSNVAERQLLLARIAAESRCMVLITEGLLIYLESDAVLGLARDLAAVPAIRTWITDLQSPGLMRMLQKEMGNRLAASPFKFAPREGPEFFRQCGWEPLAVRSALKTAAQLDRLSFFMRLVALLPEPKAPGDRPWGGIVLLGRSER